MLFLSTIKGKIILAVTLVMIACTMVNVYFTHKDVGAAMLRAQEESALNILHSLDLIIEGDFRNLLSEKRTLTLKNRQQLKDTAGIILSVFKVFTAGLPQKGTVPAQALDWLETAPFDHVNYYIIDAASRVTATSNPLMTSDYFAALKDIKHRNIAQFMRYDKLSDAGDFSSFELEINSAQTRSVLAYFKPFDQGRLTIGVSVDISQIKAMADKKKINIITSLTDYAKALKIADSGFVYMFDENDMVLIPAPESAGGHATADCRNQMTGNLLHHDIRKASRSAASKFIFSPARGAAQVQYLVYCDYFKPFKWYTSVIVPVSEINAPASRLVIGQSLIIVSMFMAGLVAVILVVSQIAKPLNILSSYAKTTSALDFSKPLPKETPIDDLPGRYRDEVGDLAASFLLMRSELSHNIRDLIKVTASRQRIESELNIAREIQLGMVPKTFPSFPEYRQFDLFATLKPAKEIGGDLYDFFQLDNERIVFTLGDVSDKGIPAALFMVVTRTLIRVMSEASATPGQIMTNINNVLSADNPRSMFVTLVIGFLEISTGNITYANGGHNPPVVATGEGVRFLEGKQEPLVGAMPGMTYSDTRLTLGPTDSIFLYTDGVNEAMNPEGEQFSNEQLLSLFSANRNKTAEQTITAFLEKLEDHARTAPQSDDIAMLMIKYGAV